MAGVVVRTFVAVHTGTYYMRERAKSGTRPFLWPY